MKEKLSFRAFVIAKYKQIGIFSIGLPGLTQKSKVPKWVCRSTLASFCNGPPFFAIFGPARGQIFGKKAEKITINEGKVVFWALYIGNLLCFLAAFDAHRNLRLQWL